MNNNSATIRVEEDFGSVKPHSFAGIEWAVDAISIQLTRMDARNEDMPVMVSVVHGRIQADHPGRNGVALSIKEQQFDLCGIA
jgi:hypothetical protein